MGAHVGEKEEIVGAPMAHEELKEEMVCLKEGAHHLRPPFELLCLGARLQGN